MISKKNKMSLVFFLFFLISSNAFAVTQTFRVYKTIPQDIPPVWTKVIFNAVEFNAGQSFDIANSRWVIPKTGIYFISAGIYWGGLDPAKQLNAGQAIELHLFRNGGPIIAGGSIIASDLRAASGRAAQSNSLNTHFWGNQGDVIELYVFQNPGDGSTKVINENWTSVCWFSGEYVSDNF